MYPISAAGRCSQAHAAARGVARLGDL